MSNPKAPYYPIIYVRGYAMTRGEIDATTADPFCGFNLGSTMFRATTDKNKPAKKFVFESPVVRLRSDFDYQDVFEDGLDIMDPAWTRPIPSRSIIIYRYYEQASTVLGTGRTPDIEEFAKGLSELILRARDLVCRDPANNVSPTDFRCYLVAHSMGGLVCRAFLQNPKLGRDAARRCVDKVFTYATPHNGVELAGINVPDWLSPNDINNFNRERMADYLNVSALYKKTLRVDWLPSESFPAERFFCMVGTNRADYEVALGLSRTFVGHGSDGLVRIENASVWGVNAKGQILDPCATAYTYRSHSGYYGIVNSEESYQNLVRFLFGDIRVDIWVDVEDVQLPKDLQKAGSEGKVDGLYQFEILASPRGKPWYLTRRVAEEDSVACRSHKEMMDPIHGESRRHIYLSTVFLDKRWRVDPSRQSLAFGLTLGVRIPDYERDQKLWLDQHYEGGYLFRDSIIIAITPSPQGEDDLKVAYDWQSTNPGRATKRLALQPLKRDKQALTIPFGNTQAPGINGQLRFVLTPWNA